MDVQDFCKQMEQQLVTFEQQLGSIENELDSRGTKAKERILPVVGDVKNLMTELKLQKDRLEKECPSEWSDDKNKMEDLVGSIGSNIDRAKGQLSQGDVGG
ncbi:MAG: hypothetical protein K9L59_06390 [Desulfobacterales bacterium]|nr:hypothetical protein [Desulfobacterales bacterium]